MKYALLIAVLLAGCADTGPLTPAQSQQRNIEVQQALDILRMARPQPMPMSPWVTCRSQWFGSQLRTICD